MSKAGTSSEDASRRRSGVPVSVVRVLSHIPGRFGDQLAGAAARLRQTRFVGLAAELAFFAAAGLVPLGVAVLALVGVLEPLIGESATGQVEDLLRQIIQRNLTRDTASAAREGLGQLVGSGPKLLLLPLIIAIFFSSRGFTGAMRGLGHLYGTDIRRPVWKDAAATIAFTTAAALLGGFAVVGTLLSATAGSGELRAFLLLRWLVHLDGLVAALTTLYRYCSGGEAPWMQELPGAALATAGIAVSSLIYGLYLKNLPGLGLPTFVGPIVALALGSFTLLFALSAILLLGGAFNAERRADDPA